LRPVAATLRVSEFGQMQDALASFALRGEPSESLGIALGRCFAEYNAWHGHAMFVSGFAQDALAGGVKRVLASRLHQLLDFGETEGLIYGTSSKTRSNQEIAQVLAEHQVGMADHGAKIAAIVMLHNAYERFLWRLVRFGLVGNRAQAVKWVAKRNVSVETLISKGVETAVDDHLEKWWVELERDSLAEKWDRLCGLFAFPAKLEDPPWHFDRDMLWPSTSFGTTLRVTTRRT
jgi:hypothetical protein